MNQITGERQALDTIKYFHILEGITTQMLKIG